MLVKEAPEYHSLTQLGRDKMAAIFVDDMFLCIFVNEKILNFK